MTDDVRDRILGLLHAGPATVAALSARLDLPGGVVNYHLKMLEQSGLVRVGASRIERGVAVPRYVSTAAAAQPPLPIPAPIPGLTWTGTSRFPIPLWTVGESRATVPQSSGPLSAEGASGSADASDAALDTPRSAGLDASGDAPRSTSAADDAPRSAENSPADNTPRSAGNSPADDAPRSGGALPRYGAPRSASASPAHGAPRPASASPADDGPRSAGALPHDGAPRSAGNSPADNAPRSAGNSPADNAPRSADAFPHHDAPRSAGAFTGGGAPRIAAVAPAQRVGADARTLADQAERSPAGPRLVEVRRIPLDDATFYEFASRLDALTREFAARATADAPAAELAIALYRPPGEAATGNGS